MRPGAGWWLGRTGRCRSWQCTRLACCPCWGQHGVQQNTLCVTTSMELCERGIRKCYCTHLLLLL